MEQAITYQHIARTGRTPQQIMASALRVQKLINRRLGDRGITLQEAVDGAIDAAIEHSQGEPA